MAVSAQSPIVPTGTAWAVADGLSRPLRPTNAVPARPSSSPRASQVTRCLQVRGMRPSLTPAVHDPPARRVRSRGGLGSFGRAGAARTTTRDVGGAARPRAVADVHGHVRLHGLRVAAGRG